MRGPRLHPQRRKLSGPPARRGRRGVLLCGGGRCACLYSLEDTASYELLGDCLAFYPDDGGGAQLLAENRSFHPVATDGENLYCEFYDIGADPAAEIPIRLYKLPLGGGESELLASDYPGSGLGCVGREILSQNMGAAP